MAYKITMLFRRVLLKYSETELCDMEVLFYWAVHRPLYTRVKMVYRGLWAVKRHRASVTKNEPLDAELRA